MICINCKSTNFIHDVTVNDAICTNCGVVSKNNPYETPKCYFDNTLLDRVDEESYNSVQSTHNRLKYLVDNKEVKMNMITIKINQYCQILEISDRLKNRALRLYDKYTSLKKTRPYEKIAAAVLIVCVKKERFINVNNVESMLNLYKLEPLITKVCNICGITVDNLVLKSIPYFISSIGLSFKYGKLLEKTYNVISKRSPHISPENKMAIALYIIGKKHCVKKDKITYELISNITSVSKFTIKKFIENNIKKQ